MLRYLAVRHLAVIDGLEVEFDPGLNVLTGETGAGKSVLVQAVGLLLGGRASGDMVRTGEEVATAEAIFDANGRERIVRREVTAQGRSRAFIDGSLATAGALKDLAAGLVELHGQHEHQTLLDPSTHLRVVDTVGRLESTAAEVAAAYDRVRATSEQVAALRRASADRDAQVDLITFQLAELERAALKPTPVDEPPEDVELAATRQVLANAERIERLCADSYAALYESDHAVLAGLGGVWRRVGELAAIDPQFQPYLDARSGIKSQLEDLAQFLRRYGDGIDASPARLQQIEERLALLERLKRKYGPELADVVARRDRLRADLAQLQGGDDATAALEREHAAARARFAAVAGTLSTARRQAAARLARDLGGVLGELAMERTRIEVRFNDAPVGEASWSAAGIDTAEFFVSTNPGEAPRPLARIVSGGELSRIMLGMKTLTAAARAGFSGSADRPPSGAAPGLIFDEVDAGIGGRVADVVGRKLRALGSASQVICITHLPQIAAHADSHFVIEKAVASGRTRTSVRRLRGDARVEELSRMLGGEAVTDAIRRSAREMIEGRSVLRPDRSEGMPDPSGPGGAGESEGEPKGESESGRGAKAKPRSRS